MLLLLIQNEKKEAAFSNILSKGQITALAALSVGDIDLLRQHLDRDHQTRFYTLVLALIVVSLSLQILGGLIAITVAHMRTHDKKHSTNRSLGDLCTVCCGCRPRPEGALPSVERCCCNWFTCRTHPAYEYNVIAEYEAWCSNAVRVEREACEAAEGLESTTNALKGCQERLQTYQKQFDEKLLDTEDFIAKKKEITQQLNSALEKKRYYLQLEANAAKFLKDGKVLYNRVDDIHRNRTMETATFFAHVTNYLLFAVAILMPWCWASAPLRSKRWRTMVPA